MLRHFQKVMTVTFARQLPFTCHQNAEENESDSDAFTQGGRLSSAEIACQHIGDLDDKALQHGCRPETLFEEFVQRTVTPPDGKDRERKVEQHIWFKSEAHHACPIGRCGLTSIYIEVDTEENHLKENGE